MLAAVCNRPAKDNCGSRYVPAGPGKGILRCRVFAEANVPTGRSWPTITPIAESLSAIDAGMSVCHFSFFLKYSHVISYHIQYINAAIRIDRHIKPF